MITQARGVRQARLSFGTCMATVAFAAVLAPVAPARAASVTTEIFGDVDFIYQRASGANATAFAIPTFDLFSTATADRWTLLGELLFEFPGGNGIAVDLERIEIGFLVANWLRLRAGRFHSSLGYYNDSYHHGTYFQVASGRPILQSFEDEGGLLPAHLVGLHADGRVPLGHFADLRFDMDLANGRGASPDEITNVVDHSNPKAFNLRLRLEPSAVEGLIAGGNIYIDSVPASTDIPTGLSELIVGAHLVYINYPFHFISEYAWIRHAAKAKDLVVNTNAVFAEAGYSFAAFTPYARFEWIRFPSAGDPFFTLGSLGEVNALWALTGGVKWTVNEHVALKLEAMHTRNDLREGATSTPDQATRAQVQCAFAF